MQSCCSPHLLHISLLWLLTSSHLSNLGNNKWDNK